MAVTLGTEKAELTRANKEKHLGGNLSKCCLVDNISAEIKYDEPAWLLALRVFSVRECKKGRRSVPWVVRADFGYR